MEIQSEVLQVSYENSVYAKYFFYDVFVEKAHSSGR